MDGLGADLRAALDADIHEQNLRIGALFSGGALSNRDAAIAARILEHNERELRDPVLGRYHRGEREGSVSFLASMADPHAQREKAYRLAIVACVNGDYQTLSLLRSRGIAISGLTGRHGHAAGFAVDYPRCIEEFLKDGMDPAARWSVAGETTDLLVRTCEVNGRPDIIRFLLARGAAVSPAALLKACESRHHDAVYELMKNDVTVSLPGRSRDHRHAYEVDSVRRRVCMEQRAEIERLGRELQKSVADHERFVANEMPEMIAAATNMFHAEIIRLGKNAIGV